MSRREGMVKRKFSFEIPKLKIGTKSESKAARDAPRPDHDSPPTTPKSVRPPLSPRTDHQLRLACAYVLQDFKPSHQIYEERYGKTEDDKPRLSYPAVEKAPERRDETAAASLVRKLSNRSRSGRGKDAPPEARGLEKPRMKPTIKSQAFFEGLHIDSTTVNMPKMSDRQKLDQMVDEEIRFDLSSFNPPIASPAFFAGVDIDRLRKEQSGVAEQPAVAPERFSDVPISPLIAEPKLVAPLKRSMSNPLSPKIVNIEHTRKGIRSESADTMASSPRTDGTENAWNSSTAPTSTAATPARGSMRSSQPTGSEKFLTADIEWMRQELEKHKRLQEEARAQQELENQVLVSLGMEPRTSRTIQSPVSLAQMPLQKPGGSGAEQQSNLAHNLTRGRSASQSIQERRNVPPVPQLDGIQSQRLARSESRRQRSTPRSESGHELDLIRPESQQSQRSRRISQTSEPPSRSLSRDIKDFFKNSSSDALAQESVEVSRASSRSRRLFQVNVRPSDGTAAPTASLQSSKPQSRSRSIESIRSAVSAVAPSIDSAANKMRSWKSFSKSTDSSGSYDGKGHSRDISRESQQSTERSKKGRSTVNLNRDLPPLPSLDQWKPEEPEKPKHIASMASPKRLSLSTSPSSATLEPGTADHLGGLSPVVGSATASTSRIQSIYSRYSKISDSWRPEHAPPYSAMSSPTVPPELQRNMDTGFDFSDDVHTDSLPASPAYVAVEEKQQNRVPSEYMFRKNFGAISAPPTPPPMPLPLPPSMAELQEKTIKRRTEDMFLPDLDAKARSTNQDDTAERPGKGPRVVNYSRSVKRSNTAPLASDITAASHSKSQSEQINFSRKTGTPEDYTRLYDMGYRTITPIQRPSPSSEESKPPAQWPQRKESKRWWKRGTSKKEKTNVYQGGKSRSNSGMILADESAPTVVRF